MKIFKRKKVLILVFLILGVVSFFVFKDGNNEYNFEEVKERNLVKEVFESGSVASGDSINLSFQSSGKISSVFKKEGDFVQRGDLIVSLDKTDLLSQKSQAENRVEIAQAELSLIKQGGRSEELKTLENRLSEAEENLLLFKRSLEETKKSQQVVIENVYSVSPNLINSSHLLLKDLKDFLIDLRDRHFIGFYTSDTYKARNTINRVEKLHQELELISSNISINSEISELEDALIETEKIFLIISDLINDVIEVSENDFYEPRISLENRNSLWEMKSTISNILSQIRSLRGEIRAIKENSQSLITSSENNLSIAISRRNEIRDTLNNLKLGGRDDQIRIGETALKNAKEDLSFAKRQIERADIYAPVSGMVSSIYYKQNEEVILGSAVLTIVSDDDFVIELDVYEADIVKIEVGNSAKIELVPFPGQEFSGEVISINEIGKLINGVVYYEVKVSIQNPPSRLMSEMTADVTILIDEKTSMSLPREAIKRSGSRRYVNLFENGEIIERDVEIGISDSYGYHEISSGLSLGDKVIID